MKYKLVKYSHMELQQNVCKGLWNIWEIPFMDQYDWK
jgi:hypothetical protein